VLTFDLLVRHYTTPTMKRKQCASGGESGSAQEYDSTRGVRTENGPARDLAAGRLVVT
jgi:hypothetical protein